jgi:hypothetical protein
LVNWVVPFPYSGPLSNLGPPPFIIGPYDDYVWVRFTVSPIPVPMDWDGEGFFDDGETCDFLLFVEETSSVMPSEGVPGDRLYANSPNPFSGGTTICYELGRAQKVSLAVYGVSGRLVRMLVDETREHGQHEIAWDGLDASGERAGPGVYFCRMETDTFSEMRRMVIVK